MLLENNMQIVALLHYLNNTPLYKVVKYNGKGEVEEVASNTKEVDDALKKAAKYEKRMGY